MTDPAPTDLHNDPDAPAHIIVFGNEKGGSGKSTSAMHVAIALLRLQYKVGTIDLDARQATLTHYMGNRFEYVRRTGKQTPIPAHFPIEKSQAETRQAQEDEEQAFFQMAVREISPGHDFIVIDTPGTDSFLSRLAHSHADTLITPVNDSLIDLDVLARIDPYEHEILGPSVYTKMVTEQRNIKQERDGEDIDWIVMRNRLSHLDARNKREVGALLERLGRLYDFTPVHGFGERVIFRELFLKGLTLLDMKEEDNFTMTMSELSARQEVRQLVTAIHPEIHKGRPHIRRKNAHRI